MKKREEEEAETNALYEVGCKGCPAVLMGWWCAQRANMPGVEMLFKTMQKEDMEGEKLKLFPEFQEPLDE